MRAAGGAPAASLEQNTEQLDNQAVPPAPQSLRDGYQPAWEQHPKAPADDHDPFAYEVFNPINPVFQRGIEVLQDGTYKAAGISGR